MSSKAPYRRHSPEFKLQLCRELRSGVLRRKDAQTKYKLSAALIHSWLIQFDRGDIEIQETDPVLVAEYEARIAASPHCRIGAQGRAAHDGAGSPKKSAMPASRCRQRDILDHQRPEGCSVRRACQVIEMPRSTYYCRSTARAVGLSDGRLSELIVDIQHQMVGCGYRRITHELRRRGHAVNHKRVARVMSINGLGIEQRRRFVASNRSDPGRPVFLNLYRNAIPTQLESVWVADIAYIRITHGFRYLAAILDACSRKVVGYAISECIDAQLTRAALNAAIAARRPSPGCI